MAKSVDYDQVLCSVAPDLGPHFLLRPVCLNTYGETISLWKNLTATTLSVNLADDKLMIFFLIFPRKQGLTFLANCHQWRQFAGNVKTCFLGKIRKTYFNMLYAENFFSEC